MARMLLLLHTMLLPLFQLLDLEIIIQEVILRGLFALLYCWLEFLYSPILWEALLRS